MYKLLLTLSFILMGLYTTNAQVSGTDDALEGSKTVTVKTNASKEDIVLTIRVNVVENK